MSNLTVAGVGRPAPVATTATELAAHIPVPARLPERFDGEPLRHLSPSSYALWVACPEAWRRRYIKGEKLAPSGSMFLGGRVDDALSAYFRRLLEHGDRLSLDQVLDLYRDHWTEGLEVERDKQGIDWEEELSDRAAFEMGRDAIGLALAELVPNLGDPVEVQRRLEFSLAPGLEWSVLCYLDLETLKECEDGEPEPRVVDFKVKGSLITSEQAGRDPQAGLCLAGRWLEGHPDFRASGYRTLTYRGWGFARRNASFQGGVPSGASLTFLRRAGSRSCRRPPAGVSPIPGPRRRVRVLDGLRRGV